MADKIIVSDQKVLPTATTDDILIVEDFPGLPKPTNRLPKGAYFSWKNKWLNFLTVMGSDISALITTALKGYVPITRKLTINGNTQDLSADRDLGNYVNDDYIYRLSMPAGVIEGGNMTVNTNPAKFDLAAGQGVIVDDWTDAENPTVYNVSWAAQTGIALTNISTQTVSHIFIDRNNEVYQTTAPPNPETRRDYIYLGQIGHTNLTTINTIINCPDTYISPVNQFRDLEDAIGPIYSGNTISANGANLKINRSDGTIYINGVNFFTNAKNPSFKTYTSATAISFRYRTQTGNGATTSDIDPTKYDSAGTITAISGTKATNQRVYMTAAGNVVVQYGQTVYNSMAEAIAAIPSESFNVYANIVENSVFLCVLTVQSNCTDLTNTTRAKFSQTSRFGDVSSSGGGSSTPTLADVLVAGNTTGGTDVVVSAGDELQITDATASRIAQIGASKEVTSLDTATYPSLTELSYVKGVTSAIQTQLDNRPVLISSATAASSATIDFTLSSGYNSFEVRVIGLIPATDAVGFWVRVSTDGGSTFASGASDYIYQRYFQNGSTSVPSLSAADSKIMFLGSAVGNGTGRYFNAIIRVWNPQSSSQYKNITGEVNTYRSDAIYSLGLVNGVYQYNTAINAIRILLSSGNISSGYFELWGYK